MLPTYKSKVSALFQSGKLSRHTSYFYALNIYVSTYGEWINTATLKRYVRMERTKKEPSLTTKMFTSINIFIYNLVK